MQRLREIVGKLALANYGMKRGRPASAAIVPHLALSRQATKWESMENVR